MSPREADAQDYPDMVHILREFIQAYEQDVAERRYPEPIHPADDVGDDGVYYEQTGDWDAVRNHLARYYLEHRFYCGLACRQPRPPPE